MEVFRKKRSEEYDPDTEDYFSPILVDAEQWEGHMKNNPFGVVDRLSIIEHLILFFRNRILFAGKVRVSGEKVIVKVGDWIVKDSKWNISVLEPESFYKKYQGANIETV